MRHKAWYRWTNTGGRERWTQYYHDSFQSPEGFQPSQEDSTFPNFLEADLFCRAAQANYSQTEFQAHPVGHDPNYNPEF